MTADLPVLVINPGAHSTRVGLFLVGGACWVDVIIHPEQQLAQRPRIMDQLSLRARSISGLLEDRNCPVYPGSLAAVVGRGGLMRPVPGGTYLVTPAMQRDLESGIQGEHASNLGAWLAREFADRSGCPAMVVDPVATDELEAEARLSGHRDIERRSLSHALNIKATARFVARELGLAFDQSTFVVAHLGSGISVAACRGGRLVDVNNANEEGPFGPDRSGGLPVPGVVAFAAARAVQGASPRAIAREFTRQGGLISYLGTRDVRTALHRAEQGDEQAALVLRAMTYQVAKEIGAMATVVAGKLDAIILTGAIAHAHSLMTLVKDKVSFIAPVIIMPGERELEAMAEGAFRVLSGEESALVYGGEDDG